MGGSDSVCVTVEVGAGANGAVLPPTTMTLAEEARETGIPETVSTEPPGTKVWLPITNAEALLTVIISLPTVIEGGKDDGEDSAAVLPLTTVVLVRAVEDIGVPEDVDAGPPVTFVTVPPTSV